MRFMMIVKSDDESEAGQLPSPELFAAMDKYNEEMLKAGVMLSAEGLYPSSRGARVKFSGLKRTVVDGPFPETKELIAGYWIIEVGSLQEAIEWAMRVPDDPMRPGGEGEIEIRQVGDVSDFPDLLPSREGEREPAERGAG